MSGAQGLTDFFFILQLQHCEPWMLNNSGSLACKSKSLAWKVIGV